MSGAVADVPAADTAVGGSESELLQRRSPLQAGSPSGKPTKAESIARSLAIDIAAGRLQPGAALDETSIAAFYGVSRTPIREAIRHLTASGMLETRPHRGAVVRAFEETELDEMFAVMADLEGLCARGAALAMTKAELRMVEDVLTASAALVATGDAAAYAALNESFHDAIYRGAHNRYLMQITLDTRTRLAPYRRAQFASAGRLRLSMAEHESVVEEIRLHEPARAFEAMRRHIVVVRQAVDEIDQGR